MGATRFEGTRGQSSAQLVRGVVAIAWRVGFSIVVSGLILAPSPHADEAKPATMRTVEGAFHVKMTPESQDGEAVKRGRMKLEKTYDGPLDAVATGEMLTVMTPVEGSAVYVAVETVTGSLEGREGSFALSHRGVMDRGRQSLTIEIVPDSGSGELAGIAGSMSIRIDDGKHFYTLEYSLDAD